MLPSILLNWCSDTIGQFEILSDDTREHPGQRASACLLRSSVGDYYLKLHRDAGHFNNEVHAYERWVGAFDSLVPRLIAVHDEAPMGIIISTLPGKSLESLVLPPEKERQVWRSAGQLLWSIHALPSGDFFGFCLRDGSPAEKPHLSAEEHLTYELDNWLERGCRSRCLTNEEEAYLKYARSLINSFSGEKPTVCHRDYCPPNWIVTEDDQFSGVIDFEFSGWDVRSADYSRYPGWEWINKPDLIDAFFEGYGPLSTIQEEQRLFSLSLYALGAVVWGEENEYYGFAVEGRTALRFLMSQSG